jgi:hypothetical protein
MQRFILRRVFKAVSRRRLLPHIPIPMTVHHPSTFTNSRTAAILVTDTTERPKMMRHMVSEFAFTQTAAVWKKANSFTACSMV